MREPIQSAESEVRADSRSTREPQLRTAVLFMVFNRPGTTLQVFDAIRSAQPQRLYVACDGPREGSQTDAERIAKVREIATQVDWPCDLKTLFRERNLGCKFACSGAITWFFEHEEQGIILEDDCLPHPDFFPYCEMLLQRHADDHRVSVIAGSNFMGGKRQEGTSYYFSCFVSIWGWATWRRAWKHNDVEIGFWPEWKKTKAWKECWKEGHARKYWEDIFDRAYRKEIDSWAYPWTASVWRMGGLTATPAVNLVSNIGFGEDSTHTKNSSHQLAGVAVQPLGKINYPTEIVRDARADAYVFDTAFDGYRKKWLRSGWRQIRQGTKATLKKWTRALRPVRSNSDSAGN